ncbi:MAG: hypothetical protein ACTSYF_00760 [Promethearchaeota archaeon]
MDDDSKIYYIKIVLGFICGILSIFIFPQDLVATGWHVGWLRFIWLISTWLLLPFPIVILGVKLGFLGMSDKEKEKLRKIKERGDPLPKFKIKNALKKVGGGKQILKTGVGAFFIIFLMISTFIFTILYP